MGSTAAGLKHHLKLKHFISWFEIPVYDIHRAAGFYNAIYGIEMEVELNGEHAMAYFPADQGVGGALIAGPGCFPSATGSLIYLNAGNDLEGVLGRVDLAGGRVLMGPTAISEEAGTFALFIDIEGNRVALHQGPTRSSRTEENATGQGPVAQRKRTSGRTGAAVRTTGKPAAAKKGARKKR